jgi:hypothetical protein
VRRLVEEVAEPFRHLLRRDELHFDLRLLGLGQELRILQRLGEGLAQHRHALGRGARPNGECASDRLRDTADRHQGAAGFVGRK